MDTSSHLNLIFICYFLVLFSLFDDVSSFTPCPEGTRTPNSKDCSKYYVCNHGSQIKASCSGGLHFSVAINDCDWPEKAGCSSSVTAAVPGAVTSGSSISTSAGITPIFTNPTSVRPTNVPISIPPSLPTSGPPPILTSVVPTTMAPPTLATIPASVSPPILTSAAPPTPTSAAPPVPTSAAPTVTTMAPRPPTTIPASVPPSPATASPPPKPNKYKVICYFTDWAFYRSGQGQFSPENIDPSLCTHIIYSFALLDPVTSLMKIADNNTAIDKKFYEQLTAFKSKGAKVTLAIGGWSDSADGRYSVMVNDPVKRANFVKQAVQFLKTFNFDGLDLDWEYPHCWQGNCTAGPASDKTSFASLVKELRAALPLGALLSAAVSASKPIIAEAYDVPTLSSVLDWIGIMDYDFHTGWERKTGHIAPFYFTPGDAFDYLNVNYSISYWIEQGADPSKLIMGVPLYGNSFLLANNTSNALFATAYAPGRPGPFTAQAGMLAYYEICSQLNNFNIVQSPRNTIGPYAYYGDTWISYDDAEIVKLKANYIKNKNLGGGMVWALDFDDFTGACGKGKYPVLTALSKTLNG